MIVARTTTSPSGMVGAKMVFHSGIRVLPSAGANEPVAHSSAQRVPVARGQADMT